MVENNVDSENEALISVKTTTEKSKKFPKKPKNKTNFEELKNEINDLANTELANDDDKDKDKKDKGQKVISQ